MWIRDPTAWPPIEEEEYVHVPGDLLEAVGAAVEQGVAEADAVASALEGALGLASPLPGLSAGDVVTGELTGLVRRALDLAADDRTDVDARRRLDDALIHMLPSQEVLDILSSPPRDGDDLALRADGAQRPRAVLASFPLAQSAGDELCGAIEENGFDPAALGFEDASPGDERCYTFAEGSSLGHRLRVYYPAYWRDVEILRKLVQEAMDALILATKVYDGIPGLQVGATNLVFSLRNDGAGSNGLTGYTPNPGDPSSPCPITVFPVGFEQPSVSFQHTVAHELFHCVADRIGSVWPSDKWWVEGAAEYFGNVVYPTANDEHEWNNGFSGQTSRQGKDITQLEYETVVFWQFYANQNGNEQLVKLLKDLIGKRTMAEILPERRSCSACLASLEGYSGMEDDWADFLVAYASGNIADTDPNGPKYRSRYFAPVKWTIGNTPVDFETEPFVPRIHLLLVTTTGAKHTFEVTSTNQVPVSSVRRSDRTVRAKWQDPVTGTIEHCGPGRIFTFPATANTETVRVETLEIELGACATCAVTPEEASASMQRTMVFPEIPEGAPEGLDPSGFSTFGVVITCTMSEFATFPECQPGVSCEKAVSTLTVSTMEERPASFDSRAQVSPNRVDDFEDPAIYIDNGRGRQLSRFWGGEQFGDNLQELAVVIEGYVHIITVEGLVVYEDGPPAVYERMKVLVGKIAERLEADPDFYEKLQSDGGSDSSTGDSSDPGAGGGGDSDTGNTASGGGGGSTGGPHATAEVDGRSFTFTTVFACTITPGLIDAQIGTDAAGTQGGNVKADSGGTGFVSIQTQSSLEGRAGYRLELSLSSPGLDVSTGSFTLVGPATRHDDLRDLGDPGVPAGEATVSMSC